MDHFTVLLFVACAWTQAVVGVMQDCWDPEKLARMNFKQTPAEANDPGLNQFSKMVKCLEMQGGGGANRQLQTDWNLWSNMGQKTQNNPYNNRNTYGSRGGSGSTSQRDNNPYNTQQSDRNDGDNWGRRQPGQGGLQGGRGRGQNLRPGPMGTSIQPKPGVHPDDWGRVNTNQRAGAEGDVGWTSRHGSGDDPPPGWSKEMTREERRKLKRDQRRKQIELEKRRRVQEQQHGIVSGGIGDNLGSMGGGGSYPPSAPEIMGEGRDGGGGDGSLGFQPPVEISNDGLSGGGGGDGGGGQMQGELTAVSLERKYSYAIMALSVVVLAVLMVATIFCCNSSNSTMAQAANARAALATQNVAAAGGALPSGGGCNAGVRGGAQFDNYSIYSYKGDGGTMGTFGPSAHATGGGGGGGGMDTLGGASLRTETLKSTRSMASRASPQYRVSDIDPDFARRFDRDNHHY